MLYVLKQSCVQDDHDAIQSAGGAGGAGGAPGGPPPLHGPAPTLDQQSPLSQWQHPCCTQACSSYPRPSHTSSPLGTKAEHVAMAVPTAASHAGHTVALEVTAGSHDPHSEKSPAYWLTAAKQLSVTPVSFGDSLAHAIATAPSQRCPPGGAGAGGATPPVRHPSIGGGPEFPGPSWAIKHCRHEGVS
jgi:hypothetical protein